jgi:hypothetical protein
MPSMSHNPYEDFPEWGQHELTQPPALALHSDRELPNEIPTLRKQPSESPFLRKFSLPVGLD